MKILFVEDNPDDLEVVRHELRGLSTVDNVFTRETLSDALKENWDLILLDLRMPELDGLEALRMAKEIQPETPVVIITGSVDDETASMACREGACDYLRKDRLRRIRMAVTNAVENAERKKREMQNERITTLGELVGGLSHDLRNVLSIILQGIDLVRPKTEAGERRIMDVMTSSVRRAEQMLQQILAFSRGGVGDLHQVSTEHIVGEIESLIRAGTMPKNIRVKITTALGTAQIRCAESEINRALWNIILNAKMAMMPGGGELVIAAQTVSLPEGEYVSIKIKDSGCGIPKEAMARLFEPFYTTRAGQGGTGLGLTLTKQIIAAHGGKIGVTSDANGTEFEVLLPVAGDTKNQSAQFDGKSACVLLVEDEPVLLAWGALRLEAANYRVFAAPNGAVAMDIFLANLDTISVLVTDINMEIMRGDQLAKALCELRPNLKCVYITGLDKSATFNPVPSAILEKPFPSVLLLETLQNILG